MIFDLLDKVLGYEIKKTHFIAFGLGLLLLIITPFLRPASANFTDSWWQFSMNENLDILQDQNRKWIDRNEAARRLGDANFRPAYDALISALGDDPDEFVRREAALSLGKLNLSKAQNALNAALNDENKWVRTFAQESLDSILTE
ncbi:MAG: HEAT repeat domain-containing protein [Deltaproteobacteria bacterium]|nr:HEAT repeat domain-containing protein [Deltaproteobacteria bacterium]